MAWPHNEEYFLLDRSRLNADGPSSSLRFQFESLGQPRDNEKIVLETTDTQGSYVI